MNKLAGLVVILCALIVFPLSANAGLLFSDNWTDGTVQSPAFAASGVDWAVEDGAFSTSSGALLFSTSSNSRISVNFGATTLPVEARFKLFQSNGAFGSSWVFSCGFTDTVTGKSHRENGTLHPGYFATSGFHSYWSGTEYFKAGLAGASYTNAWSYVKMIFNPVTGVEVWQAIDDSGTKAYNDPSFGVPWRMVADWDNNYQGITSVDKFFLENGGGVVSWMVDDVEIYSLMNIDPITFSPDGGWYTQFQNVVISCPTPGAVIRYTTDGSDPTETTGTVIASGSSILVDRVVTVKAKAWANGYAPRAVKVGDYKVYTQPWVPKPNAIQTVYRNGVPHTDRDGNFRLTYDPALSFLPIGHYAAWVGTIGTETWSFTDFANAGFNFCMPWQVSSVAEADAAQSAGIKLLYTEPNDTQVSALKNHPATLGYRMYDEPTGQFWSNDMEGHYQSFLTRMAEVKSMDPVHPFFTLDTGWILPPATAWFTAWNTVGDISSHDNYPIMEGTTTISHAQGIPETVSLAASINNEIKPVWFVAQSFGVPNSLVGYTWRIPTPAQERSMIYTSIIHGATGIIHFILDTYISRDAGCIGMSPTPKVHYGITPNECSATSAELRASKNLWFAVKSLNSELTALRPTILSPTSSEPYEVYVSNTLPYVTENPIRTLLKTNPAGGLTLLLASVDGLPQSVKIRFPNKKFAAAELYGSLGFAQTDDYIELACPAWDSRIIRICDLQTIGGVKSQEDGEEVGCSGIVSATFANFLYVESADRAFGIRVNKTAHGRSVGQVVNVTGAVQTLASGERYINASGISLIAGSGNIFPLGMTGKTLGGGPFGLQAGVAGGVGLNNIGLLVSTTGKVKEQGAGWFKIDDGSGVSVKVIYGSVLSGTPYVSVTGASSCEMDGSLVQRVIQATSVQLL